MSDKNVVRLEAQLRFSKLVTKRDSRLVATALSRAEVARVLGCSVAEVDRSVDLRELRPALRGSTLRFPASQVLSLIAKRAR